MKPFPLGEKDDQALFRWVDDTRLTARIAQAFDPDLTEALEAFRTAIGADAVILIDDEAGAPAGSLIAHTGPRTHADRMHARLADERESRSIAPPLHGEVAPGAPMWMEAGAGPLLFCPLLSEEDRRVSLVIGFEHVWTGTREADLMAAAERSFPMLRPYVRLWRRLEAEKRRAWELAQALDQSDVAVTILDPRGFVHFANGAAERLFEREDGLRLSFGTVVATSLRDALRLRTTIEHCLHSETGAAYGREETAHVLMIDRGRDLRPLVVSVAALPAEGDRKAGAVLFAVRPEHDAARFLASICRLHGLSPVETRLACHLVAGRTIAEAAIAMRIKEQTARAYLKQVFSKTETKRQAELVRLMMSNVLPVTARLTPESVP